MFRRGERDGAVRTASWVVVAVCVAALAASPAVSAFPTTGVQKLLVIPVEYAHGACPTSTEPSCPRNSAAQLGSVLQGGLTAYYANAATGSRTTWQVRVLVNPDSANGWWPAPSTVAQLEQRATAAGKNWNAFTPYGSPVRDAGEGIVGKALTRGVISPAELSTFTRLVSVHNWKTFGGQSAGSGPVGYTPVRAAGNVLVPTAFAPTAAWINEGSGDKMMVNVLEHELGHELGPGDLYGQPCPLWPPGEPAPLTYKNDTEREQRTECMGTWDLMGLTGTRNPALMYYTRTLLGWAGSYPPDVVTEPADFSGQLELGSLEYPNGKPLALHIPDDPGRLILARAFGQTGYFQGFFAECRRTPSADAIAPPGQGLLISYVDSTRPDRPIVIARGFDDAEARANINQAYLASTQSFSSLGRGFNLRYDGPTSGGGCAVFLNRTSPATKTAALIPAVGNDDPTRVRALGGTVARSVWSNPGLVIGGPRPPQPRTIAAARTAATSRAAVARFLGRGAARVLAPAPRKASIVRFAYGNAGAAAGGGEAIVRVQQPWIPQATCGRPSGPAGRVVARVKLASLPSGGADVGQARWVPKSSAPAAITVTLRAAGRPSAEAESATTVVGFSTLRATRRGARPAARLRLQLAASRRCTGKVAYAVTPGIVPKGWSASVTGDRALRAGRRVPVTIILRGPKRRVTSSALPITVRFGGGSSAEPADTDEFGPIRLPALDQTTGIDVLTRVATGRRAPAFVLPAPAGLAPEPRPTPAGIPAGPFETPLTPPGPPAPPPPPPPTPVTQSVQIDACNQAAGQNVSVDGTITPPRPGVTVALRYTAVAGSVPAGTIADRTATTNAAGGFTDSFDRQNTAWSVTARIDEGGGYTAATSGACAVPIP